MATTRILWTPEAAHFPAANFPQVVSVNQRPALAFDAAADETCYFTGVAPQGLTGGLTATLTYVMASATTGSVRWAVQVEAVTDGDATDLDAATSFDTANTAGATVPATAGYIDQIAVTLTNADSIAAGDYVRLAVYRDADGTSGTDDATGDAYLLAVELRDGN